MRCSRAERTATHETRSCPAGGGAPRAGRRGFPRQQPPPPDSLWTELAPLLGRAAGGSSPARRPPLRTANGREGSDCMLRRDRGQLLGGRQTGPNIGAGKQHPARPRKPEATRRQLPQRRHSKKQWALRRHRASPGACLVAAGQAARSGDRTQLPTAPARLPSPAFLPPPLSRPAARKPQRWTQGGQRPTPEQPTWPPPRPSGPRPAANPLARPSLRPPQGSQSRGPALAR
mmetsp:Transcript_15451/g.58511  ORF Transcript_15451/g.58511 Transcript_15451/m.58511 type:complete len:231 (+) Transcript_15451:1001-1693(+)